MLHSHVISIQSFSSRGTQGPVYDYSVRFTVHSKVPCQRICWLRCRAIAWSEGHGWRKPIFRPMIWQSNGTQRSLVPGLSNDKWLYNSRGLCNYQMQRIWGNNVRLSAYPSYYNLSSVTDSVCPLTPPRFMDLQGIWRQFYHTMIYHQFVRERVREEPHWQGASIPKYKLIESASPSHNTPRWGHEYFLTLNATSCLHLPFPSDKIERCKFCYLCKNLCSYIALIRLYNYQIS